jgi:hypothetical protein
LQPAQKGEPEPPPPWPAHLQTEDEINAWIYEANRGRSVRAVLDEMHQVHQQLLAIIEGLPDEVRIERIDPAYYLVWGGDERFLVGEFFNHFHDDHEPDVRAWLAQEEKHCPLTRLSVNPVDKYQLALILCTYYTRCTDYTGIHLASNWMIRWV